MLRKLAKTVLIPSNLPGGGNLVWASAVQGGGVPQATRPFRRWVHQSDRAFGVEGTDELKKPSEDAAASENEASTDAEASPPDASELQAQLVEQAELLKATEAELAKVKDAALRSKADMANLRTRTTNQIEEARQFALQGFSKDLLDVADNLDRALTSVPQAVLDTAAAGKADVPEPDAAEIAKNLVSLHSGVGLSQKILIKVFQRNGLEAVECEVGSAFDPNVHNAMFEVPTADVEAGCVAAIIKQGYSLKGRVIRAADVGVARPAES